MILHSATASDRVGMRVDVIIARAIHHVEEALCRARVP